MKLSIIMPAYNEARRIPETLANYGEYFRDSDCEIIVVLNGCTDDTLEKVEEAEKKYPPIRHLEFEKSGKGFAVRQGLEASRGDTVGFVDADGSIRPEEFGRLIEGLAGHDGAIASRLAEGAVVLGRSFPRNIVSRAFACLARIILKIDFRDIQCGAKLFTKELIQNVLPSLTVDNMAFDAQLLHLSVRQGYDIAEIPVTWTNKPGSVRLGSPLKLAANAFKMARSLLQIMASGK